eukprot:m.765044 g.765044  ORF g.765044 m.765044 type:complete len:74 (+) comp23220_c0_seq1:358-579(+)
MYVGDHVTGASVVGTVVGDAVVGAILGSPVVGESVEGIGVGADEVGGSGLVGAAVTATRSFFTQRQPLFPPVW